MSYSLSKHPNKPYEFPAPPLWLVWIQEGRWDRATRTYSLTSEGQVRHYADLAKAKKRVSQYTQWGTGHHRDKDAFQRDWAIYRWDTKKGEYVLQYDGQANERRDANPLFSKPLRGVEKHQPRPGLEDEVQEAIASIVRVKTALSAVFSPQKESA